MRILLLLFLLTALPAKASHLIIQSHDITAIYGDSIASYYGRTTLYKVRDLHLDQFDNSKHIIHKILQKSPDYDNLTIIGFEGESANINVFSQSYREHVSATIKEFYPDQNINVVCNTLCLNVGTIHRVQNVRELRKLLIDLDGVIVNSLTTLWDEDRHGVIKGNELTHVFLSSNQFLVSALYRDDNTHLQFWVDAVQIHDGNIVPNARVKLKRIMQRSDAKEIINTVSRLNIKAK